MTDVRRLLAFGVVGLITVVVFASPATGRMRIRWLLQLSQLPAGWSLNSSASVGSAPPCIGSAERSLKPFLVERTGFAGESNHLAELSEEIVSVPARDLGQQYSKVLRRYAACNGATWTRGFKFELVDHPASRAARRASPRDRFLGQCDFTVSTG